MENKHGPKDTSMRPMYTFYYVVLQVVQVCFYGLPQMLLGTTTWSSILKEPLPDDFIPPLPHAALASGDVEDVAHDELISTPST